MRNYIFLLLFLVSACSSIPEEAKYENDINDVNYIKNRDIALAGELNPYTVRLGQGVDQIQIALHAPTLVSNKGNENAFLASGNDGFTVSMYLEKEGNDIKSNQDCLEKYWSKSRTAIYRINSESFSSLNHLERVTVNATHKFKGQTINQIHSHAYFLYRDICVDIHASQVIIKPEDEDIIVKVMNTILYRN